MDGASDIPLVYLDTPLPCHDCIVGAAKRNDENSSGGKDVTVLMKEQIYPNLLALAAVDDFNSQVTIWECMYLFFVQSVC